ncbi:hypothetical protein BV898_18943 [Hypsibius exemplaris]|uniref:Uncharacterized protein n=1 Tax=Hypsibius exemplaris TaxID=2072580 RepID=A0A9X6RNM7_HYPEX|nr:hypothetical protein BV898_18943 [Hypsibius exemplaris]
MSDVFFSEAQLKCLALMGEEVKRQLGEKDTKIADLTAERDQLKRDLLVERNCNQKYADLMRIQSVSATQEDPLSYQQQRKPEEVNNNDYSKGAGRAKRRLALGPATILKHLNHIAPAHRDSIQLVGFETPTYPPSISRETTPKMTPIRARRRRPETKNSDDAPLSPKQHRDRSLVEPETKPARVQRRRWDGSAAKTFRAAPTAAPRDAGPVPFAFKRRLAEVEEAAPAIAEAALPIYKRFKKVPRQPVVQVEKEGPAVVEASLPIYKRFKKGTQKPAVELVAPRRSARLRCK